MSKKNLKKAEETSPENLEEATPQVQSVQPSPVPTTFHVSTVTDQNTGIACVMLAVATPTGTSVYFVDLEIVPALAKILVDTADRAKTLAPVPQLLVPANTELIVPRY